MLLRHIPVMHIVEEPVHAGFRPGHPVIDRPLRTDDIDGEHRHLRLHLRIHRGIETGDLGHVAGLLRPVKSRRHLIVIISRPASLAA